MSRLNTLDHVDGIAVIGMSCRFPGAKNIYEFWRNLREGVESVTFFSDQELRDSGIDPVLINDPNYVKAGCVIDDIDLFDASFFSYSPKEAETIDPQQRLFLECVWEAIEDAGYCPQTYEGLIGVFGGARMSSYVNNMSSELSHVGTASCFQALIGNDKDYITTRVSYKLNLRGPSIAVQSACSTSLVAVHLACESLRNGECDMALAGGAAITVPQKQGYLYQEGMIFSPDGHCRAFDARAQGIIGGNGVGIVLLKRLADAFADGDHIYAVIRGSAVNNDGSLKVGYTAPSLEGQTAVISEALAMADVEPNTITYIETHGTGTYLGDPIEVEALARVFRANTDNKGFCALGSVKTNFGHLDTAAGVASLIKTVLALKYKQLPPSLHFEKPNPRIDFSNTPFFVNAKLSEWKTDGYPRRAGVSSFGFGGTNTHVVLEEAPLLPPPHNDIERPLHIVTFSARSENALKELARRYETYLETHPDALLADVCFTANIGRSHFPYRLAVAAESTEQLREQMAAFAAGSRPTGLVSGHVKSGTHPKVAFLFTGQGSQYMGMGQQLYYTQPTFRKALDRCAKILRGYLDHSLLSVIFEEKADLSVLDETAYTQPALFSLEYALAEMWRSWGVEPSVVMGHSIGEYVAACVAGVFSLEDGLKLIAARGRLIQALPQEGEMAAVFAEEERVAAVVAPYANDVSIAAINGPENVVISGVRKTVRKILDDLASEEIRAVQLKVSHAFHSPLIDPILAPFQEIVSQAKYSAPRIGLISNVTGRPIENNEVCEASYWRRHVREPVRFASGIKMLHEQEYELFLEIGPSPVLLGMGRRCLSKEVGVWLPSLRKERSDWQQILESLGDLYVRGVDVDWARFDQDYSRRRVSLPTYPFERKRYWISPRSVDSSQWSIATDKGQRTTDNKQIWDSLIEAGRIQAQHGISELNLDEYSANEQNLRRLYAAYATLALQSFGAFQHTKDRYSVETLLNRFPIQPRYRQLLFRLLEGLVEEGQLQRDGDMYENLIPVQTDSVDGLIKEAKAMALFSENPKVIEFIQRCGENLGDVLVGKENPMEVVFPDGSFDMVESLYQDNPLSRYYNLILREIVQKIVRSLPLDSRLRILEIGAGTGSTTGFLLPELPPGRTSYLFTDVSPLFLHRAQKKFTTYPFVQYSILDIQKEPGRQGFESHSFDVVIAANVLHATQDLNETIEHIRSLLSPNGILLIREITKPMLLFDITFGPLLTDLVDEELRKGQPFLSTEKWNDLLRLHDFTEVKVFPETDSEIGVLDEHILVAQAFSSATLPVPHAFTVSAKVEPSLGDKRYSVSPAIHPLLGQRLSSPLKEVQFESQFSVDLLPFLKDHRIYGIIVVPGTVFFEMSVVAGEELFGTASVVLEDMIIREALVIPDGDATRIVQLILTPKSSGKASFEIFSLVQAEQEHPMTWRLHALGDIRTEKIGEDTSLNGHLSLDEVRKRCSEEISVTEFYNIISDSDFFFGGGFRALKNLWRRDGEETSELEVLGKIQLPENLSSETEAYRIHPVMLDACLQVALATMLTSEGVRFDSGVVYMPVGADRFRLYRSNPKQLWCHAVILPGKTPIEDNFTSDFRMFDLAGEIVAEIIGLHIKSASREALQRALAGQKTAEEVLSNDFYKIQWEPGPITKSLQSQEQLHPDQPGSWVIFADRGGVGQSLAELLEEYGETCVIVFADGQNEISKEGFYRIDPGDPECFIQLFQHLGSDGLPCRGVIHLWSLDVAPSEALTTDSLKTAQLLGCGSVLHIVQAMVKARWVTPSRLCLVTRGAQPVGAKLIPIEVAQAPLWGLSKVITREHPEFNCVIMDLDPLDEMDYHQTIWKELWFSDHENVVAFRNKVRYVPRLVRISFNNTSVKKKRLKLPGGSPFRLEMPDQGIDNLELRPTSRCKPRTGEVEICIHATGLNFRDVVVAMGLFPGKPDELGGECAGKIVAIGEDVEDFSVGDEVIAIVPGCFSTYVTAPTDLVVPKPEKLSFEEAATIPMAFLTAYYALKHLARISKEDRVLIHAAAGGVGMAAVQIAQQTGAKIFATAGSPMKRKFLESLGVEHVMNSRSLDFADEVMNSTDGEGVDIVLNSLTGGKFIPKSLSVVAANGRFLEIGKINIWDKNQVYHERKDISYFTIDIEQMCFQDPSLLRGMLIELMRYFEEGSLKPLPRRVFPIQEVADAFRYMKEAKQIGKIVVSQQKTVPRTSLEECVNFSPDGTYLITGGLGGMGTEVARWMGERGAQHLVLIGRRNPSDTAMEAISDLKKAGAQVVVARADVSDQERLAEVFEEIRESMPPLQGVFHLAGIFEEGVLLRQNFEDLARVMSPKVEGAWNIHLLTLDDPLDFFVLFSSISSLWGNHGIGGYTAANSFLDTLAHYRRAEGLTALSINWGAFSEVGMIANDQRGSELREKSGIGSFTPQQALSRLGLALRQDVSHVCMAKIHWPKFVGQFSVGDEPLFFSHMVSNARPQIEDESLSAESKAFLFRLREASMSQRQELMEHFVKEKIAQALHLGIDEIIEDMNFIQIGMDSLTLLDIGQIMSKELQTRINPIKLHENPTVQALARYLANDLLLPELISKQNNDIEEGLI